MGSVVSSDLDPCLVQLHEISPTVLLESKQTNRETFKRGKDHDDVGWTYSLFVDTWHNNLSHLKSHLPQDHSPQVVHI